MSRKGNKMAKMSSWYQVRLSELRRVFTMYVSFWQLKAQTLDPGGFGFCWRLVRRWYQCPTLSYSQGSVILGAKIRGCMWGTGGFNLLLNVPFWNSQNSSGGPWNRKRSKFLAKEAWSDKDCDVSETGNSSSRSELPWLGLTLGWCQPKSSNGLVQKMCVLMVIVLTGSTAWSRGRDTKSWGVQ